MARREDKTGRRGFLSWLRAHTDLPPDEKKQLARLAISLPGVMSEERWRHVYSVALTANELAGRYGVDRRRTLWASLGHDIAKERLDLSIESCQDFLAAEVDGALLATPALHHAALGVIVMVKEYGIIDGVILQAIRYHSTGCAGLSAVGKILFMADFVEPLREDPRRPELDEVCHENLDRGCLEVLKCKLLFLVERSRSIHRGSWEFYNELVSLGTKDKKRK